MDVKELLKELTNEEKVALVSGREFMNTNSVPRLGIKRITMADGPHGLRKQIGIADNGIATSEPAVSFPTASATASSWNCENAKKMGLAIAEEALHYGVNTVLGPGVNIKRNPLCGRNFEYFSEDPYLAGKMGSAETSGIQSMGVSSCVKHFALNNNENFRFVGDSIADERAMREIYLKPFEMIIKEANPDCIMSAYNKVLGDFCGESKLLLSDILRDEWGFGGVIMTDWGGMHDRVKAQLSGLDLEMPGDSTYCRRTLLDALGNEEVRDELDKSCERILTLAKKHYDKEAFKCDFEAHHRLATEIAEDSAVLMKNDGALPLIEEEKIAIVGDLFGKMRYQGAGSSMINATKVVSTKAALDGRGINYSYAAGYHEYETEPDSELIGQACAICKEVDKILLFIGLTDYVESEGADRRTLSLPENQIRLTEEILKLGKPVIAVLFGGGVYEIPCFERLSAILNMHLPGQGGGVACANLLYGKANPSGKLSETWIKNYNAVPFGENYAKMPIEVYKESVFVGYRYYLHHESDVAFPFGFGLSYTSFEYSNATLCEDESEYIISFRLTNIGKCRGAEAAQIYIGKPRDNIFAPIRELCGFTKVMLEQGESKDVTISVPKSVLDYYDIKQGRYVTQSGKYTLYLAASSVDIRASFELNIDAENIPSPYTERVLDVYGNHSFDLLGDEIFEEMSGLTVPENPLPLPLTPTSRFCDMSGTFLGRIIRKLVLYFLAERRLKRAAKMPPSTERENCIKGALFLRRVLDTNSIITLSMCSSGTMPYNIALGLMHISNGHIFRGLGSIFKKIKVPKLPEEEKR